MYHHFRHHCKAKPPGKKLHMGVFSVFLSFFLPGETRTHGLPFISRRRMRLKKLEAWEKTCRLAFPRPALFWNRSAKPAGALPKRKGSRPLAAPFYDSRLLSHSRKTVLVLPVFLCGGSPASTVQVQRLPACRPDDPSIRSLLRAFIRRFAAPTLFAAGSTEGTARSRRGLRGCRRSRR